MNNLFSLLEYGNRILQKCQKFNLFLFIYLVISKFNEKTVIAYRETTLSLNLIEIVFVKIGLNRFQTGSSMWNRFNIPILELELNDTRNF